jgi:hypothetical protein
MKRLRSFMQKREDKSLRIITIYADHTGVLYQSQMFAGQISIRPVMLNNLTVADFYARFKRSYPEMRETTEYYCDPAGAIQKTEKI